jgi:quinol monooxygenase YgiN
MIVIAGTWRVAPETLEGARPFFTYLVEKTRSEPGCLSCTYAMDIHDPCRVLNVIVYEDNAALLYHRKAPYVADEWYRFVEQFGVHDFDMTQYEVQSAIPANPKEMSL